MCSAIVDRLIREESICQDEVFDDISCVNDAMEQLFDVLSVENDKLTLSNLQTFISNQLSVDHHRSVRAEEDHDDAEAIQNVNL